MSRVGSLERFVRSCAIPNSHLVTTELSEGSSEAGIYLGCWGAPQDLMLAWTGQVAFQEGPPSPHSCPCGPFVKSSPSLAPWVLTSPPPNPVTSRWSFSCSGSELGSSGT